jgi:flagellar basal body-associated protein FliL
MKNKILKLGVMVFSLSSIGVGSVYIWKIKHSVDSLSNLPELYKTAQSGESEGHGSKGQSEHGSSAKEEHGEAAKAEEGHGGGHGEGHGEAKAEGGHEGGRAPASVVSKGVPIFSVDELFVNVNSEKGAHMMGLKLELELFEEKGRELLKARHSGMRDRIIEVSRDFDYEKLTTLGGKLYFKEMIVGTLNELFGKALIKEAHISSLYLQ